MKKVIVFESAEELVDAFKSTRMKGDDSPFIPSYVQLKKLSSGLFCFDGEGADRFGLEVSYYALVEECLRRCGVRVSYED